MQSAAFCGSTAIERPILLGAAQNARHSARTPGPCTTACVPAEPHRPSCTLSGLFCSNTRAHIESTLPARQFVHVSQNDRKMLTRQATTLMSVLNERCPGFFKTPKN